MTYFPKRNPPHKHFHCKNERIADKRLIRLRQEGWDGKISKGKEGMILSITEKLPPAFRGMVT